MAPKPSVRWIPVVILLWVLFGRLSLGARHLSFTSDEPSHIATGYAYIARGATWTVPLRGHPPLLDGWLALPVFLGDPKIEVNQLPGWESDNTTFVKAFVPYLQRNVLRAETASRTPAMLLTVLLAAVVARWATSIAGGTAGILSLLVLMSDPTLLAHGMLATNDVAVVALGTLALYLIRRQIRRHKRRRWFANALGAGLALGLTLLAKGSGIIWLASAIVMLLVWAVRMPRRVRATSARVATVAAVAAVALAVVWLAFGLTWGPVAIGPLTLPLPAPPYWESVLLQSSSAGSRWTYFLGRVQQGGNWAYFPIAALVKNPAPFILLALWGLASCLRSPGGRLREPLTWFFPLLYTIVAIASGVNIGYRHMLPVHAFAYLTVAAIPTRRPLRRLIALGLVSWMTVESMVVAPDFLAYFSPLVGGSRNGWRYLADSNADWGQGYKALRACQESQPASSAIRFSGPESYIGVRTYGVEYEALPPASGNPEPVLLPDLHPEAGLYAISADSLSGLGLTARDNYAWFRYHEPEHIVAGAVHLYDVRPLPEDTWLVQCNTPTAPLDAASIVVRFPTEPRRQVTLNCSQTWIIPAPEDGPGWYAVHDQAMDSTRRTWQRLGFASPQARSAFVARRLADLRLAYRQWDYAETPAFVLYSADAAYVGEPDPVDAYAAPRGAVPADLSIPRQVPVRFAGPLSLMGIARYRRDDAIEIETWWQVTDNPPAEALSVMAHVVTAEGAMLGNADGLGISPLEMKLGDTIVQRHVFELPPEAPDSQLWLRTGLYRLEGLSRYRLAECPECDAVFVPLPMAGGN